MGAVLVVLEILMGVVQSPSRAVQTTDRPVDGASARDLSAEAGSAGPFAQLTGLVRAAHSPDACTRLLSGDL
jgi:hypothetical protein